MSTYQILHRVLLQKLQTDPARKRAEITRLLIEACKYSSQASIFDLASLLVYAIQKGFFESFAKVKCGKALGTAVDCVCAVRTSEFYPPLEPERLLELQAEVCEGVQSWAEMNNRTFLRYRTKVRYSDVLRAQRRYNEARELLSGLLPELAGLNDRLVEARLIQGQIHHDMGEHEEAMAVIGTAANLPRVESALQSRIETLRAVLYFERDDYDNSLDSFRNAIVQLEQSTDEQFAAIFYLVDSLRQVIDTVDHTDAARAGLVAELRLLGDEIVHVMNLVPMAMRHQAFLREKLVSSIPK